MGEKKKKLLLRSYEARVRGLSGSQFWLGQGGPVWPQGQADVESFSGGLGKFRSPGFYVTRANSLRPQGWSVT